MAELRPLTIQPGGVHGELTDSDELVVRLSSGLADPVIIPIGHNDNGIMMNATGVGFVLGGVPVFNALEFGGSQFASFAGVSAQFTFTNACMFNLASNAATVLLGPANHRFQVATGAAFIIQAQSGEPKLTFNTSDDADIDFVTPTTDQSTQYTLPAEDGFEGAALITNGSGVLSFESKGGAAFPVANLYAGRRFFHTGFRQDYTFDGTYWLGPPVTYGFGRNGGTNVPAALDLRMLGNVLPSSGGGYPIAVDFKIIRVEMFTDHTADPVSGTLNVVTSTGTNVYTRIVTAENSVREDQLNVDVNANTTAGLDVDFTLTDGEVNDLIFLVTICERRT